jgi:hypothetical protein
MSCAFSRETLALHVAGDLQKAEAACADAHLATCGDCRDFLDALRQRQSLLETLRRETASADDCAAMRHNVMSIVNDRRHRFGWLWHVERFAVAGFQQRPFAVAALTLLGVLSVSVVGQMRDKRPAPMRAVAVFEGDGSLRRPEGYRGWTIAERSTKTGQFPEGTVRVWERSTDSASSIGPHKRSSLLVSVKNSARFRGGWGFFDFTASDGGVRTTAPPLPESSGCRTCHRPDDATDHPPSRPSPLL